MPSIPSNVYSSNPRPRQPTSKAKPKPKAIISKSTRKSLETLSTIKRWKNELKTDLTSLSQKSYNSAAKGGNNVTFDLNDANSTSDRIFRDEDKVNRGRVVSNFGGSYALPQLADISEYNLLTNPTPLRYD